MFLHKQVMHRGPRVLVFDIKVLVDSRETKALNAKNSYYVHAANKWNFLPIELRNTDSDSLFNKKQRIVLMESKSERLF